MTVLVVLAGVGCAIYPLARLRTIPDATLRCLRAPQRMTLYSIDPSRRIRPEQPNATFFHRFRVLGETSVTAPDNQRLVTNTIERAVIQSFGLRYICFDPRHGVRVSDASGTYDFLICFSCGQLVIFSGDQQTADITISGSQAPLDVALRAAHVPLATR